MATGGFQHDMGGWNDIVRDTINTVGVSMAEDVAEGANAAAKDRHPRLANEAEDGAGHDNYMVSVEGGERLNLDDYHATVITATAYAMRDNAKHNTLVSNFARAAR